MKHLASFALLIGLPFFFTEAADTPLRSPASKLTLNQFLAAVAASNLDYAAQRYNVSIAQAQVIAAKVSPNPQVQFGYAHSGEEQATTYNGGVTQTIEVAGKRKFRTTVAQKNLLAAAATLEDFFRLLRGTATNAYIDAVASRIIVEEKRRAYDSLNKLADANAERLEVGDIGEVDVNQARVDALQARGDLTAAESTAETNAFVLVQLLGKPNAAPPVPTGNLEIPSQDFNLNVLLNAALQNRPDVVAARRALESARTSIRLTRANRYPDLTVGGTLQHSDAITNPIDPAPSFNSAGFTVSVPLPLFNSFRGEYQAAVQTSAQAEKILRSTELKVQVDVRQNYARFQLAKERLAQYQGNALDLAEKVLQAKLTSYQKGAATLLDVLAAQKAATDVRLASIDALTERAKALVALEQAAYVRDINF